MNTMEIMIDTKVYAVINTTEYNDGNACVQVAMGEEGASELGWTSDSLGDNLYTREIVKVSDLRVGEIMESADFVGAYIMRVA
jgi:hypothetical protein